jgi:DNA-binding CsgD family transcriptional regulator
MTPSRQLLPRFIKTPFLLFYGANAGTVPTSRAEVELPLLNGTLPRSGQRPGFGLKSRNRVADTPIVDAAERKEILNRYRDHSRRFEAAAARRSTRRHGSVIPFAPQIQREVGQDPTAREIEVLQLVADGLVNREIGERLFLSEETVKSHVRHLLAKLQARSRAHAVAVGFRRGLIA